MTTALLDTEIKYSRTTKDYDVLICGQFVGSAATYGQAEQIRTQALAERRDEGIYATVADLDPADGTPGIDDNDPGAPADPDPAPGLCPDCGGRGPCFTCGAIDLSAIGRRLRHEMHDDRAALLRRLRATPRRFWAVLAHAYVLEIGHTPNCNTQPAVPGVVWLWSELLRIGV